MVLETENEWRTSCWRDNESLMCQIEDYKDKDKEGKVVISVKWDYGLQISALFRIWIHGLSRIWICLEYEFI